MKLYDSGTSVYGWNFLVGDVVRVFDNKENEHAGKIGVVSAIYTGQDAAAKYEAEKLRREKEQAEKEAHDAFVHACLEDMRKVIYKENPPHRTEE